MSLGAAPKVSVCVITYNHAPYIAQALDSILAQEVDFSYEIVVADDCSTDGTREILRAYAERHPGRFRLILQPKNIGQNSNFVDLFNAPESEYVALLDGDDFWTSPKKLGAQVAFLDAHPDHTLSCHETRVFDETQPESEWLHAPLGIPENPSVEDVFVRGCFALPGSFVFRRSALERLPTWANDLRNRTDIGDMIILAILAARGKVRFTHDVWAAYRQHAGGTWSRRALVEREEIRVILFEGMRPEFPAQDLVIRTEILLRRARLARAYIQNGRFRDAARHLRQSLRHLRAVPRWSDRAHMAGAEGRELWTTLRMTTTGKIPLELRRTVNRVAGRTPSWDRARPRYSEASHP